MTTLNPIRGIQIHTEMHIETHTQGETHREHESEGSPAENQKMRSNASTERCQKGGDRRKSHRKGCDGLGVWMAVWGYLLPKTASEGAVGALNGKMGGEYAQ